MVSTGCPNVFFLMARFMSSNSADAGSSNLDAIVVFAFVRIASELSSWVADARFVFAGLAGNGVTAFATFLGFAGAGIGVNGAGVISSGVAAAVLSKQACAAHPV